MFLRVTGAPTGVRAAQLRIHVESVTAWVPSKPGAFYRCNASTDQPFNAATAIALKSYRHFLTGLTKFLTQHRENHIPMKPLIKRFSFLALLGAAATVGCQTQQQMIQSQQAMAIQTALNRARFEMGCQSATGTVLSTNVSQPSVQGRFVSAYGVQRLEYTVGVRGCGQRRTYIVVCPQGGAGCFAAQAL